jgi:hypothetical protein
MSGSLNLLNISSEPEFTKGLIASRISAIIKSKKSDKKKSKEELQKEVEDKWWGKNNQRGAPND